MRLVTATRATLALVVVAATGGHTWAQYRYGSPYRRVYAPYAYNSGATYVRTARTPGFTAQNYAYGSYGASYAAPVYVTAVNPYTAPAVTPARANSAPVAYSQPAAPASPTVYYYGTYGLPSNFYQPTTLSYLPYAQPGVGYTPGRAPVTAVTYSNGATLSQSYTGYSNAAPSVTAANLGYPSYVNTRGLYGQDFTPGQAPAQVTYGQSTQAALTPPGYFGNYVTSPGATYQQTFNGPLANPTFTPLPGVHSASGHIGGAGAVSTPVSPSANPTFTPLPGVHNASGGIGP